MKHFEELYAINVNDRTERLKQGSSYITYLSWSWAWAEIKKRYPDAVYKVTKFEGENGTLLPYMYDPNTGYMVSTSVTLEGLTHEMWLPVMDGANKAMKAESYTYKVKDWKNGGYIEKEVQPATMFDINKAIMRCLTKNLAMFGLGLYIYAGEDIPESEEDEEEEPKPVEKPKAKMAPKVIEAPDPTEPEGESLVTLRAKLNALMDRETWDSLVEKQGQPETWSRDQLLRWIKKLEEKNA